MALGTPGQVPTVAPSPSGPGVPSIPRGFGRRGPEDSVGKGLLLSPSPFVCYLPSERLSEPGVTFPAAAFKIYPVGFVGFGRRGRAGSAVCGSPIDSALCQYVLSARRWGRRAPSPASPFGSIISQNRRLK